MDSSFIRIAKVTLLTIFFIAVVYILIVGRNFLYPIALALLLSYLLFPFVSFFEKKIKLPRFAATLLAILLGIGVIFVIGEVVMIQIKLFIRDFAEIKTQAMENLNFFQRTIEKHFHFTIENQEEWVKLQVANMLETSNKFFSNLFKTMTGTIGRLIFIPIFSFFMLFYRDRAKNFVIKVTQKESKLAEKLLNQISNITIKYVTGVLTVVSILAISHSVALSIIGVKYAIFLGIFAASISIIPYFGTLASTLIPLTFSLILTNNPYEPMWIIIYFLIINSIENNILTPTITGGNVNLNPFITILGLILGAMIWGIPGMIIIIPTLGVIKIICDNIDGLEAYGYILGIDKKPKKIIKRRRVKKE